jgi:serine/threonine protein kinase
VSLHVRGLPGAASHPILVSPPNPATAQRLGQYSIEVRLATGGQSHLYLGRREGLANAPLVVLKVHKSGSIPTARAALHREAEALRSVQHENIVRLIDDLSHSDGAFLVLEHVPGIDLHHLLNVSATSAAGVPFELASFIGLRVAAALTALHGDENSAIHVYHGDLSPANILLSEQGSVRLTDFGLARIEGHAPDSRTRRSRPPAAGVAVGHRGYMAPERLEGFAASAASDIFALGATLGELLIGRSVFAGEGALARLVSAREGNVEPLLRQAERFPPRLVELCQAMLRPVASERPTARTAMTALTSVLQNQSQPEAALTRSLGAWVSWANNQAAQHSHTEQQLRHSLEALKSSSQSNSGINVAANDEKHVPQLRPADTRVCQSVSFSELISLAVSGKLRADDEVALWGDKFERVSQIPALARHIVPLSSALTSQVSPLGPADYCVQLQDTPLINILGHLATRKSSGVLFVERDEYGQRVRKDVYVNAGRVSHITAAEPHERLGELLIQAGNLTRQGLNLALKHMVKHQGQLGESLVALKLIEPTVVYQALCNQGRDRIVALCGWSAGTARFFTGASAPEVAFPLDLDLHLCLVNAVHHGGMTLPDAARLLPGPDCPASRCNSSSLPLLNLVPSIARKRLNLATAVEELSLLSGRGVTTSPATYLIVAHTLGWVDFV